MYRMRKKQPRCRTVLNYARSCFYQYANHLPNHLLSIELKYPGFFFDTFRFAPFHFIIFCASWVVSCEFTLSKGKKNFEEMLMCLQRRHFVSISLHLHLYTNYCLSAGVRWRRKCWFLIRRCLPFWAPFLFWLSRFYKLSFRLFIPTF